MLLLDEWATRRHAESWYAAHSEEDNHHADLAEEIRKEACWALSVCFLMIKEYVITMQT